MPPSGYRKEQSSHIASFLVSISQDLKSEAKKRRLQPSEALKKEIANIQSIKNANKAQQAILDLTASFYEHLKKVAISNWNEFDAAVQASLPLFEGDILAIKGPKLS